MHNGRGPLTAGLSADQKKAMAANPRLTKADFYTGGSLKKAKKSGSGGGRHVASKAGEKRYGLPIGTELGHTKSKNKGDAKTQQSYATFMAADTPAAQKKEASWLSTDDLTRAGEALFSFKSTNARDESARKVLVDELAARGIDAHTLGYDGPAVVVNPNPKKDPVAKAAATAQHAVDTANKKATAEAAKADAAQKKSEADAKKAADAITKSINNAAVAAQKQQVADTAAAKKAAKDAADLAHQQARKAIGDALASGLISQAEARDKTAQLGK